MIQDYAARLIKLYFVISKEIAKLKSGQRERISIRISIILEAYTVNIINLIPMWKYLITYLDTLTDGRSFLYVGAYL